MKSFAIGMVTAMLVTGIAVAGADKTQDAERLLKAAMNTELVDGNLKAAIEQYKKVTESGNRALAAQALVHMAECYQKLGDAEAQRIYERLVRDFSDQKDVVAIARTRISGAPAAQAKGDRPVWTGPLVDLFGQVSPDGRFITYVDWASTGNVMVHDVVTNTDRRLTQKTSWKESGWQGGYSTISRDGKQVAYTWNLYDEKEQHLGVYIAPLQGSPRAQPRQLLADVSYMDPSDWSPDGKWIAGAIENRKDGSVQIALASVAGGSLRVLKSLDWRGPGRIFFSPDGRYIAYRASVSETTDASHVLVMAVDASRETTMVAHQSRNWPLGWSPDGSRLLFASDRTGSVGLWTIPVADGRAQGEPELVKADIGSVWPLGVTASGALYVMKEVSSRDVHVAPIDVNAGKLLGPATSFAQGFVEAATDPDWSSDGKYLAYAACQGGGGQGGCIAIRSIETGQTRRLRSMWYARLPRWSPDARSLIFAGRDLKGRNGVFQIDAQSGQMTPVMIGASFDASPQWSRDGKKIYYYSRSERAVVERDAISGTEREVFRHPLLNSEMNLSPDGKYFAATTRVEPASKTSSLLLVPVTGGASRELLRLTLPETFSHSRTIAWTPDNTALLVQKQPVEPSTLVANYDAHAELWSVPVAGGQARRLDIDVDAWRRGGLGDHEVGFGLSPDGRHVAFLMGKRGYEVWALENFLPSPSGKQ